MLGQIIIEGQTDDDIGEYDLIVGAILHDPDESTSISKFTVSVIDLCADSIVNSDQSLVLDDMIAPDDQAIYESRTYSAPQNSAHLESDMQVVCGPLSYTLLYAENDQLFNESWF